MVHLSRFKEAGVIKFERTLQIPMSERIPALIKEPDGELKVCTAIVASLKSAFDNINLKRAMDENQVVELAGVIIDQAHQDQLALEDVLLFLQRLVTGQAGTLYDRLDIPTFFELFETYREERYQALRHIKDEQHVNYKAMGDNTRYSEVERDAEVDYRKNLVDHFKKRYNEESGHEQSVA